MANLKLNSFLKELKTPGFIFYCSGVRTYHKNTFSTGINYTSKNGFTYLTACLGYFNGVEFINGQFKL